MGLFKNAELKAARKKYEVNFNTLGEVKDYEKRLADRTINLGESTDQAEIVLGLCEGEIEGLEEGPKSFYVSDTALENANGDKNFEDFALEVYPGSGADEVLAYFLGGASRSTSVGIELKYNIPVVRQTETGSLDFIELRFTVPSLYQINTKKGSYNASELKLMVEYKPVSADKWSSITGTNEPLILKGKITGVVVQEFRIEVEDIDEPYEIRVTKLTEDVKSTDAAGSITWESYQEGFVAAREFPHTALAHIHLQYSNQLTSVPSFYGIYKLMKIRIPSNYNPETREYDGEWDGTFKIAWSNNPAWCLYDFIMNDRYGVNAYSPVTLDKWDCYEAGQWCDELVNDGRGGKEPRYTCNLLQTEATNGREFALYLAGLFNGVLVEAATGYLRLFVEKEQDAVFLFTPENVTEEGFSYSFTSPETRYNDVKVSFTNPEMNWEADTRRVYNQEDIDINGRVTYDFIAVGCIREGEAMRRAYYKLITALTEKITVNFTTNRQAQCLSNFDIILVSDPVLGYAIPGRIKYLGGDRKTVFLRDPVYLEAGISYKISFNVPEGLFETEIDPISGSGNITEFTVKDALPENLPELATFSIYGSDKTGTPKPFRVMSITEGNEPDTYTITALEINRGKWTAADNMTFQEMEEFSGLPSPNNVPHVLDASFFLTYNKTNDQTELYITPQLDPNYPYYSGGLVVYSKGLFDETWTKREVVNNNIIIDHPAGKYDFVILPQSTTGLTPTFETAPIFTYEVEDVFDYPSPIKNLQVERTINGVQLSWDPVDDIDLRGYEIREGRDWDTAEVVTTNFMGTTIFININDSETHQYLVKAKNYRDIYSQIPALVSTSVYAPDDVPQFYATTSKDRIRFDWTQVEGIDVEYEIREGNNWSTGLVIARVKGNNTTVLIPARPNATYCIKAVSSAGLYSENPRYLKPDVELFSNRNIILEIDNGAEGFPGITYGFEPLSYVDQALVMQQECVRAEHYFPVHLKKNTRARNWFETEAFSYSNRLRWEDLHYRFSSAEAHVSWINSKGLRDSDGEIECLIMKSQGPENYKGLYGFPYSGYTHDYKDLIYPAVEKNISYSEGRITQGLAMEKDTYIEYSDLVIPDTITVFFKVKVDNTSEDDINFIMLYGTNTYMKVYMYNGNLYLRVSDHKDIILPIKRAEVLDFLTIGISQSATERTLYFFADYANYEVYETIEAEPVGFFNQYFVNRKIGEYNENVGNI